MKLTLFCVPYAGGSATIYHKWRHVLDPSILLMPVELAGRGKRMQEPLYPSFTEAVEDVCRQMEPHLGQPYILYGHSMGSTLVYEASRLLKKRYGSEPLHLFVSGRQAPHIPKEPRKVHLLPDEEFKAVIERLGGTPSGLLDNQDLFDLFSPILRSDYRMLEEYSCSVQESKLDCSLTVMSGCNDNIEDEALASWGDLTSNNCSVLKFDGGHFFIHEHYKTIVDLINKTARTLDCNHSVQ